VSTEVEIEIEIENTDTEPGTTADLPSAVEVTASGPLTCVTITWANGSVTTVYPPETPTRRPADATPPSARAGKLPRS
jgi:hypothetical protein